MKSKQKKKKKGNMVYNGSGKLIRYFQILWTRGIFGRERKLDPYILRRELVCFQTMARDFHDEDAK